MSDDEDLRNLFKRLGIGIAVLLVFCTLFYFVLLNRFSPHSSKVVEDVNNKKSIYVLIDDNKCSNCKDIKRIIEEEDIPYYEINIDKATYYEDFLSSISATKNEVVLPTLIFVREGNLDSTMVEINDEGLLKEFIERTKGYIE